VNTGPVTLALPPRPALKATMTPPAPALIQLTSSLLGVASSWALVTLGVAHIGFGIVKYRAPLRDGVVAGFVGRFSEPEMRRTAFWFVLFGLPLLLAGHLAVRAAGRADNDLLGLVGGYVFATSLIGVAAFPRSPFPASLIVSVLLILAGHGF
jgi:hypothetical protein